MSTTKTETPSPDQAIPPGLESTSYQRAPKLSHRALTTTLVAMCVIPVGLITVMFLYLPQVHEGDLQASVSAEGLPSATFYQQDYTERPAVPSADLVIRNESDQDWTHLNIQINRHYQIYEREPIPAGEERRFQLHRFVSRTGATFDLRYNPLKYVRIYARRPTKDRATYSTEFDWEGVE
ncbi:MAG: hypothetical protein MK108_06080 [Mariniblastus sp.]|nr:hypothetical protein [Mariniblastus sp.]